MSKEEIYDLLNRLDLQEWCTELYKVPLTWCELYDIRDYLINLEQQCKKQKEVIDKITKLIKQYGKYDGRKCTRGFQMWAADFNKLLQILEDKGE